MEVIDAQIDAACGVYGLGPLGRVPVKYDLGFESENRESWSGDDCWEIVCSMADGDEYPEASALGFAAGHMSPGWKFLRELCDHVAGEVDSDWFEAFGYDEAREYLQDTAEERARLETWPYALVCVADIGVDETTEDASVWLGERVPENNRWSLSEMAWGLLGHAGYLVLREVFAPQIDSKNKE